jgi:hypothetical protein
MHHELRQIYSTTLQRFPFIESYLDTPYNFYTLAAREPAIFCDWGDFVATVPRSQVDILEKGD